MYEVRLHPAALEYLEKQSPKDRRVLAEALTDLERDPTWQNPNVVHLLAQYAGFYRYRKGVHRLIFKVEGQVVHVHLITLRRDSY